MQFYKKVLAAAALAFSIPASAGQFTDVYWVPTESGWGANIVQQDDTAFVTLFVQGADGKPTWFSAAVQVFALSGNGLPQFRGALYRTEGPAFNGPFNPALVRTTAVGTLNIETRAQNDVRLIYDVDGAPVTKAVVRQSFRAINPGGNYLAAFNLRQSVPGSPPFGTFMYRASVEAIFDARKARFSVLNDFGRSCVYAGTPAQTGKFMQVSGTFACSDASQGTFEITDLEHTTTGITGTLRTVSANLIENGRFAGARL